MGHRSAILAGLVVLLLAGAAGAAEEEVEQRLRQLEDQNREILERLRESEARNDELERRSAGHLDEEVERYLQASAQAGFEGLETKKGAFVKLYGFVRLDLYYNTARASNVIVPTTVQAEDGVAAEANDEVFALDPRLTRIGFDFTFGKVGASDLTARIETDFANFPSGSPESRPTPRIRVAWIQIENERWLLRIGQDWDNVSPLYPTANNETLMWNAGNPGDRRAQIAWTRKGAVTATIAIGLTGAINNQDLDAGLGTFTTTERDGFDSGWPQVQVRLATTRDSWVDGKKWTVGVWGMIGGLETDTTFNGEDTFTTYLVGIDFTVPVTGKVLVKGEFWFAQAGGDIRANIGQTINTTTGEEIAGWGGWIEGQFRPNERWMFHVGGSVDDPDDGDIVVGNNPELNLTVYTGVQRYWTERLKSGFDVVFWETQYTNGTLGNMVRFDFYVQVDF